MNTLWSTLIDLLRLKAGPQDLPDSRVLAMVLIVSYLAQEVVTSEVLGSTNEPFYSLVNIGLYFGIVAAMLLGRRQPERLQQTLTAFAATGFVLGLVAFFLLLQVEPDVDQPLLAVVWFAIFGWRLAVEANIFRHALGISLPIGMLVTVMLLAIRYVVLQLVFT